MFEIICSIVTGFMFLGATTAIGLTVMALWETLLLRRGRLKHRGVVADHVAMTQLPEVIVVALVFLGGLSCLFVALVAIGVIHP